MSFKQLQQPLYNTLFVRLIDHSQTINKRVQQSVHGIVVKYYKCIQNTADIIVSLSLSNFDF